MARWIDENHRPKSWQFKCSECGETAYYPQGNHETYPSKKRCGYKYCPNCGKKIDADRKTENSSEIPTSSTISKMEQVDWKDQMWAEAVEDEPQTDCPWK